jgi:TPR repeat protein
MLPYTLGLDAQNALDVLQSMADKGQITWAAPPLTVKIRMRIILRKFLEAANRGDAWAQVGLGSMYYIGHCVRQDFKEALKWTQQAADQGLAEGQFDMGVYFDEGLSVKQNFKAAVRYYRQAAKKGLAKAQYNLGIMYRKEQGVKKDSKGQ